MIIERMVFQLRFGKAREAIVLWKKILEHIKQTKKIHHIRMLTDLTGPSYTLVIEMQQNSLLDMGPTQYLWMTDEELIHLYREFVPLCESSSRTLYHIECEI